jgi:hypothetical protein
LLVKDSTTNLVIRPDSKLDNKITVSKTNG